MGGSIWAESEGGRGSTFSFTIQLVHPITHVKRDSRLSVLREIEHSDVELMFKNTPHTMLMVDQNAEKMVGFVEQFARWGIRLLTATTPTSALKTVRQELSSNTRLSGVLINHSGEVSLLDLVRAIRAEKSTAAATVPIVAFLPSEPSEVLDLALVNELCSSSLKRPVLFTQLRMALETLMASLQSELSTSHPGSARTTPRLGQRTIGVKTHSPTLANSPRMRDPLRSVKPPVPTRKGNAVDSAHQPVFRQLATQFPLDILIVEDNAVNSKLLCKMLSNMGYDSTAAGDGAQALSLVRDERLHFDLIFMDKLMPVMGGVEATRRLLEWYRKEGRGEPVICAMTASAMAEDKAECKECGMRDFISKPVNAARLRDVITSWGSIIVKEKLAMS